MQFFNINLLLKRLLLCVNCEMCILISAISIAVWSEAVIFIQTRLNNMIFWALHFPQSLSEYLHTLF